MGAGAQAAKAVTLTVFLVLTLSTASAASLTLDSEKTQWLNSGSAQVEGTYACDGSAEGDLSILKNGDDYSDSSSDGAFSVSLSEAGNYEVKLDCNGETNSTTVEIRDMQISLVNSDSTAYKGEKFSVTVEDNQADLSKDNLEFQARFVDYEENLDTDFVSYGNSQARLDVSVPENISSGNKALIVEATYGDGYTETTDVETLQVNPTWGFNVSNVEPGSQISYQNLDELSLDTKVTKKGEPVRDLSSDDFYVTVEGQVNGSQETFYEERRMLERILNADDSYTLNMKEIPELDLGRYNFRVGLDRDGGVEIANFTVSKYILFSGEITNSAGQPVDGEIRVSKDGFEEVIDVDENGEYSGQVLPGEYNFTLNFPSAQLSLQGVDLKSSRSTVQDGKAVGTIRYDDIPVGDVGKNMQGVTVSKALAVWFGYPYDEGRISMNYDTTKVNPSKLRVFECVGWNINGVSCYQDSEWESVGVQDSWIHPTVGTVTFPVTPYERTGSSILYNGYMVVKNTQMNLDSVEIGSDRVKTDGQLTVQGKVTTPSGDAISNADISIQVVDPNSGEVVSTRNVTSGGSGTFSGNVNVPSSTGQWDIRVGGQRKPYSGFSEEVSSAFSTYIERSVSVSGPSTVNFVVGSESSSEFTIINDGQTPVNNVNLALTGFDREWYSFSQNSWDTLSPGESVQAELITELPNGYCEDSCQEYKTVTVETTAEADGKINDMVQIQAQIRQEPTGTTNTSQGTENTNQTGNSLPDVGEMTGKASEALKRQSNFNLALGMIMVFLLVLAAAVQKKKNGDDRSRPLSGMKGSSGASTASSASRPNRDEMRKSKPDVSNSSNGGEIPEAEDEPEDEETNSEDDEVKEDKASEEETEESSEEDDGEVFECGTCGEEFDTESARELHEKAIHE